MGRSCRKRVRARLLRFRRSSTSSARARFLGTAREHPDAVRRRRKFFCCSENCSRCRWLRFPRIHSGRGRRCEAHCHLRLQLRVDSCPLVVKQKSHAQSHAWLILPVQHRTLAPFDGITRIRFKGSPLQTDTLSHCGSPAVLLLSQNRTRTSEVNLTVVVRTGRMCAANALRTTRSTSSGC